VQEEVLAKVADQRFKVFVVWTPVLPTDSREAAVEATRQMNDQRVVHLWDAKQKLGLRYGKLLELPGRRSLAWDVYFVFDAQAVWADAPPIPLEWMHQLGLDERLLNANKLRQVVRNLLARMPAAQPGHPNPTTTRSNEP